MKVGPSRLNGWGFFVLSPGRCHWFRYPIAINGVRMESPNNEETNAMADEKQMSAVRFFCRKTATRKGNLNHDGSDLVQQISYFDFGHIQKDEAMIQAVARLARKEFPNGEKWDKLVNVPGAHENILTIIRTGLAALLKTEPASA
jgi:hypothetical protein